MDDGDAGRSGGQLVGDLAGAVGGAVVDDQHVGGHRVPGARHGLADVLGLVVRGDDHDATGLCRLASHSATS